MAENIAHPFGCGKILGEGQRIIAVCGIKNSGKTTLLVRLVRALAERGITSAVIKHDGHEFACDVPGTDSFRFWEAGALGTAVYSGSQTFIRRRESMDIRALTGQFPGAQIVFIEGIKESPCPKIEVIRKGISKEPVSNPRGRFLIVTDYGPGTFEEETAGFDDLEKIIGKCIDLKPGLSCMMEP